jgi:hypothetical protein
VIFFPERSSFVILCSRGLFLLSLFLVSFIIPKKKMMVEKVQETVLLSRLKKNK